MCLVLIQTRKKKKKHLSLNTPKHTMLTAKLFSVSGAHSQKKKEKAYSPVTRKTQKPKHAVLTVSVILSTWYIRDKENSVELEFTNKPLYSTV